MSPKTDTTKTILTITVGFIVIYLITKSHWAILTSLATGLIGMFSVFLSKKIEFLWMKLTWILSLIVPNILMGIVFYLILFPISLLAKLFQKDSPLKLKNKMSSVFNTTDKHFDKASFDKPW